MLFQNSAGLQKHRTVCLKDTIRKSSPKTKTYLGAEIRARAFPVSQQERPDYRRSNSDCDGGLANDLEEVPGFEYVSAFVRN